MNTENQLADKSMTDFNNIDLIQKSIKLFHDFPKPGLAFLDIFSVLNNVTAFNALIKLLLNHLQQIENFDVIVGLEARGFLFGPLLAYELGVPFVPIRKKGKLPGEVKQVPYTLEYGTDVFEIQSDSIEPSLKVVVIDDVLATGGSIAASCQLISQIGAKVVECLVVVEIEALKGREKIPTDVYSIILHK
uniref:Adenine phosphoribosyltransferase n=1 Tax=Clastoptera arizonana TaxID=38151 RepID=A0A1B6D3W2_9HEMI